MFPEQDRQNRYRGYLVLLILLFIVVIISNTAQALEDFRNCFSRIIGLSLLSRLLYICLIFMK